MDTCSKPRVTGSTHRLPFDQLSPLDFERLCLWLVRREGYERAEHLGEAGSEGGRDVVAWKKGRRFVFQCKRVKAFTATVARQEIGKIRSLQAQEQPDEMVFVVSQAVSADTRSAARAAWGKEASCHFWAGGELDERVKRHPALLEEFFQLTPQHRWSGRRRLLLGASLSVLGLVLTLAAWIWPRSPRPPAPLARPVLYSVRVQVLDPQGHPVEAATVRASAGEPQQLPGGGWEVEIPTAKVPADGRFSLWAEHEAWEGNRVDLRLGADPNLRLEIRLKQPEVWLRGRVDDDAGNALPGVRVSPRDGILGVATTDTKGYFALRLPVASQTRVRLRAEYPGRVPGDVFCYAGRDSCSIMLEAR